MKPERLNELIDALNNGQITPADRTELMQYYNSYQLSEDWDFDLMGDYEETKERIFAQVLPQQEVRKVKSFRAWIGYAAASLLLVALSWLGYSTLWSEDMIIVSTDRSSQEVLLPDGTRVVLNINSQISYPKKFATDRRAVKFEGEGYFDVAKDSLHPFVIETDLMKVHVLGTVFNLKSYRDDPKVETSLLEGRVALLSKDEKTTFSVLAPNQKFSVEKQVLVENEPKALEAEISIEDIQYVGNDEKSPVDLAWKEGKFAFSSATLLDVASMIKRQYGVQVKITNDQASEYKYTAIFEDESVDEILKLLSLVKHFNYRREGNDVIIY